ncbi:hypothetical protein QF026_005255 [Streptomyces aurantiacus]|uniref:effector-associated constant component EACC1 n=1 Tax=Streptomyces aurantiacus TaxID=47760 RepID=UPI002793CBBE|nr:hypothetical protein [Streptomyces aurantiacus]MDQ0776789.1 hypothetical protein [Streptomyces aurantiacus]
MRIEIRVGRGDGSAAPDLHRWLRRDPRIRRYAEVSLASSRPDVRTMGTFDMVNVVVGQGIAALNLALSYAAWRGTRRSSPPVTFTVNGESVTVEGRCDEATIRRLRGLLGAGQEGGSRPDGPPLPDHDDDRCGPDHDAEFA